MAMKIGLVVLDAIIGSLMLFCGLIVPIFFLAVMLAPLFLSLYFTGFFN